ncbi:MAG: hypothetical protein GTO41_17170 [Burkholderiales bacterium]|nr:hypothetical protein [Burkholderiales bacterium]
MHKIFPTCLYVADVENGAEINRGMLPHLYRLREQDRAEIKDPELLSVFDNEVWTTYFSRPGKGLIDEPWTQQLQEAVLAHVQHFAAMLKFNFGDRKPRIMTLFANIHDELYHRHDAHTHPGAMFSGSYYVKIDPGAGRFRLINPARALQFHEFSFNEETELNVNEVSLDPVQGRLVMFQSHVPHAVDRPTARGERVAVSFNVNYE